MTEQLSQQICAMYDMGESRNGIARMLSLGKDTVSKVLKSSGVEIGPSNPPPIAPYRFFKGRKYRKKRDDGYWRATTNPKTYLHVDVWEEYHKRVLPSDWDVHHIDHDKDNNSPENLKGMPKSEHGRKHNWFARKKNGA